MIFWNDHANNYKAASLKGLSAYRFGPPVGAESLWGNDDRPYVMDIDQGEVQDCFMLASAASLSIKPERIKRIFLTKELNDEGIVAVRFFVGGRPRVITIDSSVPLKNSDSNLFSQTPSDKSAWIPLLEKAYAKLAGNYEKIELGWMSEAMRIFTGAPSHRFTIGRLEPDKLW